MGVCSSKIDVIEPEMTLVGVENLITKLLTELNAYHCNNMRLHDYYTLGLQDSQRSPNMTPRDIERLDKIGNIIYERPYIGTNLISRYLF